MKIKPTLLLFVPTLVLMLSTTSSAQRKSAVLGVNLPPTITMLFPDVPAAERRFQLNKTSKEIREVTEGRCTATEGYAGDFEAGRKFLNTLKTTYIFSPVDTRETSDGSTDYYRVYKKKQDEPFASAAVALWTIEPMFEGAKRISALMFYFCKF